jgi:uncharacterized protein (DUF2336 family)
MIHAEDFRKQLAPVILTARAKEAVAVSARERVSSPGGITLSVSQVLLAVAIAIGSLSLFIWALVKLWLFGR